MGADNDTLYTGNDLGKISFEMKDGGMFEAEEAKVCGLSVYKVMLGDKKRTVIPSLSPNWKNLLFFFLMLALLMIAEALYKKPFLDFTLSPDGIEHTQKITPEGARKFWKFETNLGGGKEIYMLILIGFLFCSRSRFMYYTALYFVNQFFIQFFKLAYNDPRPYMISSNIRPFSCSIGFGNPSGHSSSASLFAVLLYLDLFHGSPVSNDTQYLKKQMSVTSNWAVYALLTSFFIFWAITIPYTRFLMGVHSLDQIVYGSTLGVWGGLFLHFIVRDNVIRFAEKVIMYQNDQVLL